VKFKILFLILAYSSLINGQTKLDSAKLEIAHYPDSTELYLKVARPYLFSNIDSASLYLKKALAVANKNRSSYEQGRVFDNLGIYYGIQSKYDSALYYYKKSVANFREINDEFALANVLNNLGLTLSKKGDFEGASVRYQEAVGLYQKLDRLDKAARTYSNLGLIFEDINDPEKALYYFNMAITTSSQIGDDQSRYTAMNGKAEILIGLEKYREALIIFDSAHQFFKGNNQTYYAAITAHNVGYSYMQLGEYTKANNYMLLSLAAKKKFNDQEIITSSYANLAQLKQKQHNYARALLYVDSAIQIANNLSNLYLLADNTRLKSMILLESGNYQKSSKLFANYIILQDSLNEVLQTEKISELNNKYEVAKKDKELAYLILENEKKHQELKITRIIYLSIALIIIALAASIIFYLVQLRQKDKLRQSLLNEEIDGLRLRLARIMSDVELKEITIEDQASRGDILEPLTEREIEILKQAITNKANAEIADTLHISTNTVKYHLKNIYIKLGVNSKLEARAFFS